MSDAGPARVAAIAAVGVPVVGAVAVLIADAPSLLAAALLVASAVLAAVALLGGRDRQEDEARHREAFRQAMGRLGEVLGASDDREALVRVTLDAAVSLTEADGAVLWMDTGPALVPVATSGAGAVGAGRLRPGEGLAGAVASTGEPARWSGGGTGLGSAEPASTTALAVPVRARGRLYGVLALYRQGRAFGDAELDDVVGLASQAGSAIDTTYLHEDVRRQSLTDGLTGLWNRRQFELRAAQELERAARFGERFSIVLVDLDDFKAVNDTHGHLVGDAVLVEAAKRLTGDTREVDTVARFGGEEFVLLLPQTDGAGAVRVAEKVRSDLVAEPVPTDAGPLAVTLSAGVASHPDHGGSLDALLAAADAALYTAKAAGKNRVVPAAIESGAAPS